MRYLRRSRLAANTLTLTASNAGTALLALLLSILIGRVLGEDGLGVYATALAWIFPLALLADFGLGTLLTRDLAQDHQHESIEPYLRAASSAILILGGLTSFMLFAAAGLLSDDPLVVTGIRISAPLILIQPLYGAITAIFRSGRLMWPVAALNLGMLLVQLPLTVLAFSIGGGIKAALLVNLMTSAGQLLAAMVALWLWYRITQPDRPLNPDPGYDRARPYTSTRRMMRRAWPFALAAVLAAMQMRLSIILLERFTDTGEVGAYAAALRFFDGGRMVPNALFGALLPALSQLTLQADVFRQTFARANGLLILYSITFGLGCLLLASWLIDLTFGPDFASAAGVLTLLGWSMLPLTLRHARTLYWFAHGQEAFVNRVTAITLVLQFLLSLWLISEYGAMGAAGVAIMTECAALILLWSKRVGA